MSPTSYQAAPPRIIKNSFQEIVLISASRGLNLLITLRYLTVAGSEFEPMTFASVYRELSPANHTSLFNGSGGRI